MGLKKKHLQIAAVLLTLIIITVIVFVQNHITESHEELVIITFAMNGLIWMFLLIKSLKKAPYSLEIMHWFFCLFFFFFAAITQYINGRYPWNAVLKTETFLKSNNVLLLWTCAVLIGMRFARNKKISYSSRVFKKLEDLHEKRIILTCLSCFAVATRVLMMGFGNMLSRSTVSGVRYVNDPSLNMMISGMLQASTYFAVLLSFLLWKKSKTAKNYIFLMINGMLMVVGYFPTGMARYAVAVLYLGTLLTCTDVLKRNRNFILLFIFAFIVILPVMNTWRFATFEEASVGDSVSAIFSNFSGVWLANDYDSYVELSMSIEYVDHYGTGGMHILSIILFWVPRSLWHNKAFPGSHDVTLGRNDVSFDNVSCTLPEEGILDGGVLGVFLLGLCIGYIIVLVDRLYHERKDGIFVKIKKKDICNFDLVYPAIVIFSFFLMRGDMMYTFPYLVSYLTVWFFITYCIKFKKKG